MPALRVGLYLNHPAALRRQDKIARPTQHKANFGEINPFAIATDFTPFVGHRLASSGFFGCGARFQFRQSALNQSSLD